MKKLITALIQKCSTDLPSDAEEALRRAYALEEPGTPAYQCFAAICENIVLARENEVPMCQDTGVPLFDVSVPDGFSTAVLSSGIIDAVQECTEDGVLRPNCVDTLTGRNTGTNTGLHMPFIKTYVWGRDYIRIRLLLKGGGSENVSGQYKLPFSDLQAERDLEGAAKTAVYHVLNAQGRGCAPGIIGVGIGGDREESFRTAKKQLFRDLGDENTVQELRDWENTVLADINRLGIGPMGLGGMTTALAVKAGVADRHPACFFLTLSYLCWAARRYEVFTDTAGHEIFPNGESAE